MILQHSSSLFSHTVFVMSPLSFFMQTVLLLPTFTQVFHHMTPRHRKGDFVTLFLLAQCLNQLKSKPVTLLFLSFSSNRCLICSPENNSAERVKSISCASSKLCFYWSRRNESSVVPDSIPPSAVDREWFSKKEKLLPLNIEISELISLPSQCKSIAFALVCCSCMTQGKVKLFEMI